MNKSFLCFLTTLFLFCLSPHLGWAQDDSETEVDTDVAGDVSGEETVSSSEDLGDEDWNSWSFHSLNTDEEVDKAWRFKNTLDAGFDYTGGNSRAFTLSGMEEFTVAKHTWLNTLKGGISYSRNAPDAATALTTSIRFFFVKNQTEWHFHEKLYALVEPAWFSDKPSGLKADYRLQTGLGYFVVDEDSLVLRIETGYHFSREEKVDPFETDHLHSALMALRFYWAMTESASWENEVETYTNLQQRKDFRSHLTSTLRFFILRPLSIAVSANWRFDNRPVTGFEKSDISTTFSVGLTF